MLKHSQAALDDFAMAIKLSPHCAHIYFNRANLFVSLNMLNEAEHDYSTGLCLCKHVIALTALQCFNVYR